MLDSRYPTPLTQGHLFSSDTLGPLLVPACVCFAYLVFFQCYLSLVFAANEGSNTPINLLMLFYSLNKVGRKETNPVPNFSLKWKRRHSVANVTFTVTVITKGFLFLFKDRDTYFPPVFIGVF